MNFKEIQELVKLINDTNLTEFKMKNKDVDIQIRTDKYQRSVVSQVVSSAPMMSVAPQSPATTTISQANSDAADSKPVGSESKPASQNLIEIKSPIVGTFYRSSGPDKPAFVKVGDKVTKGNVVCIIEAMKLFNEIESDVTGTIVKVCVEDAAPVEYDQILFLVEA